MIQPFVVVFGKAVRRIARLRGGEGSALPGLFVERIDPGFLARSRPTSSWRDFSQRYQWQNHYYKNGC